MEVTLPSTATRRCRRSLVEGNTFAWICADRFSRVISITREGLEEKPRPCRAGGETSKECYGRRNLAVGGSCGFALHDEKPWFRFELPFRDLLELELTNCRGMLTPPADAALFDPEGQRKLRLGAVVFYRFVRSHQYP